jgi:restriction endonuclease S subunit
VKHFWENGTVKWISAKHIDERDSVTGWELITEEAIKESATNIIPANAVVVVTRVSVGKMALLQEPVAVNQDLTGLVVRDPSRVSSSYLFWAIKGLSHRMVEAAQGLGVKGVTRQYMADLQIPFPPLDVQEKIAAALDGYRKVIEGAKQVIANYKPTIRIDPQWPTVRIGDLCPRIQYGLSSALNTKKQGYKTFRMNEIVDGTLVDSGQMKRADISSDELSKYRLEKGDILFNRTNSYEHVGRTGVFLLDGEYAFASYLVRLSLDKRRAAPLFVNLLMNTPGFQQGIKGFASRAIGQANISASNLASYEISLPPLPVQRRIVEEIEAERALVEANRKLVEVFDRKIQTKLAQIWGEASE